MKGRRVALVRTASAVAEMMPALVLRRLDRIAAAALSAAVAYAEASARRLAARRTGEALELFERLPGIEAATVEDAKETFARWEQETIDSLSELDRKAGHGGRELRRRQAEALGRVAAAEELRELAETGLLPAALVQRAAQAVAAAEES